MSDGPTVRPGRPDDLVPVMRVLDGALLDIDAATVGDRLEAEAVLVATTADTARVVGALVLDGDHIEAVAVTRSRRRSGVGTALVEAALARRGRVTATFRPAVRAFYEALGFDVDDGDDGRLWGVAEN